MVLRCISSVSASAALLACTMITGSADLHTETAPVTNKRDSGKSANPDPEPEPEPIPDDGGTPLEGGVGGPYCTTHPGFDACLDFEDGKLDTLAKNVVSGTLTLEQGALLSQV